MFKWIFLIFIIQPFFAFANEFENYNFLNGKWKCVGTIELTDELTLKHEGNTNISIKNSLAESISTFTTYNRKNNIISSVLYVESTESIKFNKNILSSSNVKVQKTKIIKDDISFLTPDFIKAIKSGKEEVSKATIKKLGDDNHTLTGIEDGDITYCSRLKSI